YRSTTGASNSWASNTIVAPTTTLIDDGVAYVWSGSLTPPLFSATGQIFLNQDATLILDGDGNGNAYITDSTQTSAGSNILRVDNQNTSGLIYFDAPGAVTTRSPALFFNDSANAYATEFSIQSGGQTLFKNQSNSTTAFQIQNSGATPLLTADSTNSRITVGNPTNVNLTAQLDVVGNQPTSALSTVATGGSSSNSPWIAVQGKDLYEVNENSQTMRIMDISTPSSLSQISSVATTDVHPLAVTVQGHYAYVSEYGVTGSSNGALEIFDISNPNTPSSVGLYNYGNSAGPLGITVSGRYAYVLLYNSSKLAIMDISNPTNPTLIGSLFSIGATQISDFIQGRYLYIIGAGSGTNFQIVDVSNPASPVLKSTYSTGLNSSAGIYVSGRYAYIGNGAADNIKILDISNPTAPSLVGTASTYSTGIVQNVWLQGRYLYAAVATPSNVVQVFDVSTPSSPVSVGTITIASSTSIAGFLSSYVVVSGRYGYVVSDTGAEVQSFDLGGAYVQQLEAGGVETGTLTTNSNANIGGDTSVAGGLQVAQSLQVSGNIGGSGSMLLQNATNSTNAFQVQNASGTNILNVDTTNSAVGIGISGTATQLLAVGGTTGNLTVDTSGNLVTSGTINTDTLDATHLTFSGSSAPAIAVSTANTGLSVKSNGTGVLILDSTGTGAVNIGVGSQAKTIQLGDGSGAETQTIKIGNNTNASAVDNVTIGTFLNGSSVALKGGTGNISLTTDSAGGNISFTTNNSSASIIAKSSTNSATAFQVQNSGSANELSVDTTDNVVVIGSATSDATQILLELDSYNVYADTSTCGSTTNQGALYYNTNAGSNSIRACINGSWQDLASTEGLNAILFGVVPDSGSTPGDLVGITSTLANAGPCKVYDGSAANTIRWTGCIAYSSGRKQIIAAQSADVSTTSTASNFQHLCVSTSGSAPTLTTASATETADLPSFSATAPILCLATIKENGSGTALSAIYDTRFFTTTTKETGNLTTASAPGQLVKLTGTAGQFAPTSAASDLVYGVVVATDGTTTANSINAIIATAGPVYVEATAGSVGQYINPTTTAGYVNTSASAGASYTNAGLAQSAYSNTCSTLTDNCRGSLFTNLNIK
ncbi:MAG: hypothetical protein ACHQUB_03465, partial [Candidatus Saccharimonadia bacterium]